MRLDLHSFKLVAGKNIEIEVEQAMSRYVMKSHPSLAVMDVYGGENWWCLALNPPKIHRSSTSMVDFARTSGLRMDMCVNFGGSRSGLRAA